MKWRRTEDGYLVRGVPNKVPYEVRLDVAYSPHTDVEATRILRQRDASDAYWSHYGVPPSSTLEIEE